MSSNHVGKLLWESIEEQLPQNACDEARLLVGADLIEQNYELKSEIDQFLALSCKSEQAIRPILSRFSEIFSEKRISQEEISLFLRLFKHETCSPEKGGQVFEAASGVLVHNPDLNDFIVRIRKQLREEAIELRKCLEDIQEAILNNFVPSDAPAGDCTNVSSVICNSDVIGYGDTQVKIDELEINDIQEIESHVKRRGLSNGRKTPNIRSSGSSLSTLSATSSTSVSPRTPPQESTLCISSSSRCASSLTRQSPKTLHLKNTERLSPSSKALYAVTKTPVNRKSSSLCNENLTVDPKSSITLPPLNPSVKTVTKRTSACDRRSPGVEAPQPVSTGWCRSSGNLCRFNSAQRFRQMVLRTRQRITDAPDCANGE